MTVNGHSNNNNKMDSSSSRYTTAGNETPAPLSKRIRKMMEPLIMSLVTTIVIFHLYFAGDPTHHPGGTAGGALDAPQYSSSQQQQRQLFMPVKRRYPNPPSFEFPNEVNSDSSIIPIFYHIYVPDTAEKRQNALRIILEQLDAFNPKGKKAASTPVAVFYQTIGEMKSNFKTKAAINNHDADYAINEESISKLCHERNLQCHFMGQYDDGREELTLQRVYDFCQADAAISGADQRRVMYLHNKGSHHYSIINERWRRTMMKAITHEKCLKPPMESCTICGLYLTAERGIFMAGNFWVAKCSYLRNLLPPLEFEGHMERVVKEALYLRLEQKMTMNMHKHWPPSFGTGRYAAEYWSGSHPEIVPCDFSHSFHPLIQAADNTLDFLIWVNDTKTAEQTSPSSLKWTMAPKHPIKIPNKSIRMSESLRLPEYFLLAGNILRWYELYDSVPGEFSWVWAWFPDGRKWRTAIRNYGRNALYELTKDYNLEHQ